jgi:hypothetical protein
LRGEFDALRGELPDALRSELESLTPRTSPKQLNALLVRLCEWRPLGIGGLAGLTGKSVKHLRERNLRRLLVGARVHYLYPEEPNHPHQKYTAGKSHDPRLVDRHGNSPPQ